MKARINEILNRFREFVSIKGFEETPILTAYINVDPTNEDNRKARPAWMIDLKNEAKRLEEGLDKEKLKRRATQNKWANTEEGILARLKGRKPEGRSVVIFTDHAGFLEVDLPLPVTTRLYYGFPQMKHMLFNLDQYKKYLVVLLSGAEVRVLEVYLARTTDEVQLQTNHELQRRLGRSGHADNWESRDAEYERKFTKEVSGGLNQYFLGDPDFERLVLGGNQKLAHAVRHGLHPSVRDRLVSIESIDFKASEIDVADHIKKVADQFEVEHDLTVVEDIVSRFNRDGTGVVESQGVAEALARGQVKTLVIPYPMDAEEFDRLLLEATRQGAEIEFVYGPAAEKLNEFGGVGARLYFAS